MHVGAKRMAISGMLLAFTVICMFLGGVIETNTLFLLAAAAYFVGIIQREFGLKFGWAFWIAAAALGFILVPNKFYVLSYSGMALYILVIEGAWNLLGKYSEIGKKKSIFWMIKYIVFNLMYIPIVIIFQEVLFARTLPGVILAGVLAAGQIGLFIFDQAYEYVQANTWKKLRRRLLGD
ncbi:MAG: hypothetical protein U0L05_05580 [Schaedlerella sp.]|nr:hypothetical protein [Schaedlerella sp.]